MHHKHKRILISVFLLTFFIAFSLNLNYLFIATEAINIMSISSAIYFGTYAGIQSSERLKQNLKKPDKIIPEKSQLSIINHYLKLALFFCFITIIISSISILFNGSSFSMIDFIKSFFTLSPKLQQILEKLFFFLKTVSSSLSIGLFFLNLTLVLLIGTFFTNRISYDK